MELFHVLNRGVDKRKIFLDEKDYFRFIHDLYEFNDQDPVISNFYHFQKSHVIARREGETERKIRKLLVDIHVFCLMPNHYHLLVSSRVENGISRFMKKLNMGYARYFNEKYERTGALFEGRFKSVPIKNESHFTHIPYYIHLNPLDLITPTWRERRLDNPDKAIKFLESYRWSSYLDYIGKKNFPSVINKSFLAEVLNSSAGYKKETTEWIRAMDYSTFKGLTLE